LLDKPLSNLDAKLRASARDELRRFQQDLGTTTIYVTHDQAEAMGLGDRIAVLADGQVRQVGPPVEVYDDPADTFVATFIGSPPMNLIPHDGALVGFRPEHLLPVENVDPSGAARMPLAVDRMEYLSGDRHVYGTVSRIGVRNFSRVFEDPVFWRSLSNTFVFTVISMVLIVLLGKVLANILVADFRGKWVVRFLVLLPWTTPVALSSISWLWLLDSIYSPIDWVLRQSGTLGPAENMYWLGQPRLAMASVIAVHVWRLTPLAAVIMMAGLMAIPKDIDEAARVDGAGYWRRMFEITIPLLLPVAAVAALFGAIFTFTDMAVVRVLTRGGPNDSTQVLASWAFYRGIE